MKLTELKCPYCGAPVTVGKGTRRAKCDFCRSTFAVEREPEPQSPPVQPRPTHPTRPTPQAKKKSSTSSVIAVVLIFALLALWQLVPKLLPADDSADGGLPWQEDTTVYRTQPESEVLQNFATAVFEKEYTQVQPEEYATIAYFRMERDGVWESDPVQIKYAFAVDEAGDPVDPMTVRMLSGEDVPFADLQIFSGLVTLDMGASRGMLTDTWDVSLKNMRQLSHLRNASFGVGDTKRFFATPEQVVELSGYVYGNDDLAELAYYPNLTTLQLQYVGDDVDDFSPLTQLTQLRTLGMQVNSAASKDLSWLASMTNLTELELGGSDTAGDFSVLYGMPQLTRLSLTNLSKLKEIGFVANMPKLSSLLLYDTGVTTIEPLRDKTGLTDLSLEDNSLLTDVSAITSLTGLQKISWWNYTQHPDNVKVPTLYGAKQLQEATLDGCYLTAIAGNTTVTKLTVIDNTGGNLENLRGMNQLTTLLIPARGGAELRGYDALKSLTGLTTLVVDEDALDYKPADAIFQIPNLTYLEILPDSTGTQLTLNVAAIPTNNKLKYLRLDEVEYFYLCDDNGDTEKAEFSDFANALFSKFTALEELHSAKNKISDVNFVTAMPNLRLLDVTDNYISDVAPLGELTSLRVLFCKDNMIQNLNVLPTSIAVIH